MTERRVIYPMTLNASYAAYATRIVEKFDSSHEFKLTFNGTLLALAIAGSHSHGTNIPSTDPKSVDDVDFMGVVLPPPRWVIGLETFEHWEHKGVDEIDVTLYSFHKIMGLLAKGNPNVLSMLWLRDDDFLYRSCEWTQLQKDKQLFSSKAIAKSFLGYASGQLHKMTSYTPAIDIEIKALEAELAQAGWVLKDIMENRPVQMPRGLDPTKANEKADRLRSLRAKYHSAYMGEKRRKLVVEHGYDTKNAAHTIRLLKMCYELMKTGEFNVFRTHDAEQIKDIKQGKWELNRVKEYAEHWFEEVRMARDASSLPDDVNHRLISEMTADIVGGHYRDHYYY